MLEEQLKKINELSFQTNKTKDVQTDKYDELKKLKELLDLNIISQEEFDKKKKELLDL